MRFPFGQPLFQQRKSLEITGNSFPDDRRETGQPNQRILPKGFPLKNIAEMDLDGGKPDRFQRIQDQ